VAGADTSGLSAVGRRRVCSSFVPLLTADDPPPVGMRRVLVLGTSGAGKTTLADQVADVLALPRVELDALYHGPGWQPRATFAAEVGQIAAGPAWVLEWQYTGVLGDLLPSRADTVLWLDHSRWLVMRQIIERTVRRRLRRQVLWNGNVEPPLRTILTDPEHVVRFAWRRHDRHARDRLDALLAGPYGARVTVIRLAGRREVVGWLDRLRRHAARTD
jgi:adenylate kinase family enzyme